MFDNRFAIADLTGGQLNALVKMAGGADAVRKVLKGELKISVREFVALQPVGVIDIPQTDSPFVAEEKFRAHETIDGVKIFDLGHDFKRLMVGKVEQALGAGTVRIQKTTRSGPRTAHILAELGEAAEIPLAHFWEAVKQQSAANMESSVSSPDQSIYAFVRDVEENLKFISAMWQKMFGWSFGLREIEFIDDGRGFIAGLHVLSR